MSEHTPTTEQVREIYGVGVETRIWLMDEGTELRGSFDRWLEKNSRMIKGFAWAQGMRAGYDAAYYGEQYPHNPYAEEES